MSPEFQAVLDNTIGYHFTGITQPADRVSSQMLWNPPESGVVFGITQLWFYKSTATEINMKRRTTTHGTGGVQRNSAYFPGNGGSPASTPIEQYSDITSTTAPAGNALFAFGKDTLSVTFKNPVVLGPGEGVIFYPDTTAAHNWTLGAMFEVHPVPTP